MNPFPISIVLLFLLFLGSNTDPTPFTGDVSINCGSAGASAARNGRRWLGDDVHPQLSSFLRLQGSATASIAAHKLISAADPVPHKTARLSRSQFSYVFRPNPGQNIIRLHFNHASYKGFKGSKDLFSVEAGHFTLLSNFSASLTAVAMGVNSFTKEFVLMVRENQPLTITFSPESSPSQDDTHALINGIEFIPVPSRLYYFGGGDVGLQLQVVGQKCTVYVDDETALEIVHRLNIEEDLVPPDGDFNGLFPKWATQRAEKMHSKTWKIRVDVGFRYLIRVHFSEKGLDKASADAMFKVLVNEMVAHFNTEMVKEEHENNLLLYMDYLMMMRGHKQEGKHDISISFQSRDGNGLLAGFEILKLSNPDNSLASPNPLPPPQGSSSQAVQNFLWILGHRYASGTVFVIVISLLSITVHTMREIWEARCNEVEHKLSARAERLLHSFSLADIELATRSFSNGLLIGRGGFGKVYKGVIDKGQKTVAIKRLNSNSQQGACEFWTEVEVLSELRHINVISLIGYCNKHKEKILVYEYMPCGTLADHLYKYAKDNVNHPSLTWKQRLNICIGAARGLDYLHTGHGVIHRDVKASNILLDESFRPKLSDFGLAKHENKDELQSHVSTKVKGTNGYLDPHYFQTSKLTRKSDTYAFGVVLLTTLCGRPAVHVLAAEDERILSKWAKDKIGKGEVDQIVASSLKEEISSNSLRAFVEVAERCLNDEPNNRPTMSQIVTQLEFALQQQDSNQNREINDTTRVSSDVTTIAMQNPTLPPNQQVLAIVGNDELTSDRKHVRSTRKNSPSRLKPWDAFWKRVKPSKKNAPILSQPAKLQAIIEEEFQEAEIEFCKKVGSSKKIAVALSETAKMESTKDDENQKADKEFSYRVGSFKKNPVASSETAKMEAKKEEEYETEFLYGFKPSNKTALALSQTAKMEARKDIRLASILDKVKLCKFDENIIAAAWNQFSSSNKVGQGRFGSVYKVLLPSGKLVAVKRLSESSRGVNECYNEILLISNLQHQNIVKLLGHCSHRGYIFRVYEFMENTSLDTLIDKEKENSLWLLWPVRYKIITGIARGLAYLHQDSELRVTHRDLKLRHILLDSEMNPRISHFGHGESGSRSLEEWRSEYVNPWYMPPECPIQGRLSVKADVYNFGIIVLEILTGTRTWNPENTMTLRNYVQNLWDEGEAVDVVDKSVGAFSADEALRCIEAALLCTQWDPDQRPEMPSVLNLLSGE